MQYSLLLQTGTLKNYLLEGWEGDEYKLLDEVAKAIKTQEPKPDRDLTELTRDYYIERVNGNAQITKKDFIQEYVNKSQDQDVSVIPIQTQNLEADLQYLKEYLKLMKVIENSGMKYETINTTNKKIITEIERQIDHDWFNAKWEDKFRSSDAVAGVYAPKVNSMRICEESESQFNYQ